MTELTVHTCKASIYDPASITRSCALPLGHSGQHRPEQHARRRFCLPRRRWVVESRPAMLPKAAWHRSLGPYFLERTARDMMRRAGWFGQGIVAWRVRRV